MPFQIQRYQMPCDTCHGRHITVAFNCYDFRLMRSIFFVSTFAGVLLAACGGSDTGAPVAPPTATISAAPVTVNGGSTSLLTWTSTNAASCTATGGWNGNLATSGSQSTVALSAGATYSLTCSGPGGVSAVASVTVNVRPAVSLTASAAVVTLGDTTVLTWTSSNASSCTASGGWSGSQPTNGSLTTGPIDLGTVYTLTCAGLGGNSSPSSTTVNVVPTAVLTAAPNVVGPGSSSLLRWDSTNASSCQASGGWSGVKAPSGSVITGALSGDTTYAMSCSGPGGSSNPVTATVAVAAVTLAPRIAPLTLAQTQQFAPTLAGSAGDLTWSVDGVVGGNGNVGSISPSGVYTAGTSAGNHTIVASSVAHPQVSASAVAVVTDLAGVYTYHNDLARDGANTQEYALNTANVNSNRFGKLFSCVTDGALAGQPLWAAGLLIGGTSHNVVFVATEHDSLYAFDGDASPCQLLWTVSLIDTAHGANGGETPVPSGGTVFLVGRGVVGDIAPEVGVTGTPVIDPNSGTLFVVSKSVNPNGSLIYQRLHAIDWTTGKEQSGSPVSIAAMYPGTGDGSASVAFAAGPENQRAGLAWVNGVVYVTWAAHEDVAPWYGWVMGYAYGDGAFSQTAVFNAAPDAQDGGIWMGAAAPASDTNGYLYLITGNGTFDAASSATPNTDYGDSLLRLTGSLSVANFFTPSDQANDAGSDKDFGAGGAAMLADLPAGSPVAHLLICGGKDGSLYVLNRDLLGGFGDSAAVQKITGSNGIFSTGAFWNSNYYLATNQGNLIQYALDASVPSLSPAASSAHVYGFGGSTPSVSAAGPTNGIVWTLETGQSCIGLAKACGPAVLYAHDAANVANELWNSSLVAADAAGNAVKFMVPTVANGKVYVGTRGNNTGGPPGSTSAAGELDVYGLKPD